MPIDVNRGTSGVVLPKEISSEMAGLVKLTINLFLSLRFPARK